MEESFLEVNLQSLPEFLSEKIRTANSSGEIFKAKSGDLSLKINDIVFHSSHDPAKEALRLIESLKPPGKEDKLYIFFGAGLGYGVRLALEKSNITVIWMECDPIIFKFAFEVYNYAKYLQNGTLRILLSPFNEDNLFTAFKGLRSYHTSFIPHRPSLSWKENDYSECKFICEKFFRKKDVNIATLSKFETVWTRNLLQNIPEILKMKPISLLFGIAKDIPILVCGAGPSLYNDLDYITNYRDKFILICVDTALNVLHNHDIEPDLIYSVDPQTINKSYLEGYNGNGIIVFDPTSCYHTLRLPGNFSNGFFTSSPFPLIKLITNYAIQEIGDIPFGGSVSTNAISLAELMGAKNVLILGQDLAFTDGFAHCKGAILEERLNHKESRLFRRELHNFKQLFALPKIEVKGKDGNTLHTNEKMQIFRKWFSDRAEGRNWINMTSGGGIIDNIPISTLHDYFNQNDISSDKVRIVKEKIINININNYSFFNINLFINETIKILDDLKNYEKSLLKGVNLSKNIYTLVQKKKENTTEFHSLLKQMDQIDEIISSKKGLSDIIGLGVQRVILMITEGYESNLSIEEKKNNSLSIAKKSILLYQGLYDASKLIRKTLKKSLSRAQANGSY
jgi:hypothetical protein